MGKRKRKGFYAKKQFLNKPYFHQDASIFSEVEITTSSEYVSVSGKLKISDCYRYIDLEIELESEASYKNTLFKVDTLISNLQGLREACVKAREFYKGEKERISNLKKEEAKKNRSVSKRSVSNASTRRRPGGTR